MCVTVDEIKLQLGITGTTQDAKLQQFLGQAQALAESYTRKRFSRRTWTEYYNGMGTEKLVLRHTPVISITSIHVDPDREFGSGTLLEADEEYTFDSASGIVYRLNGAVWPGQQKYGPGSISGGSMSAGASLVAADGFGLQNIKVIYLAGVTEAPEDIRYAIISLVALLRRSADKGGPVVSESLDYYSYSLAADGTGASEMLGIKSVLDRHKTPLI